MTQANIASGTREPAPDVILVGSGIMSATLGTLLKLLKPELRVQVYEVTSKPAQESSHGWNNAGTGHAGLCELSYTPFRRADGTVDISKAIEVFEEFELSRQFWSFAVDQGILPRPRDFIRAVPHISFVTSAASADYLHARYRDLSNHHFFRGMEFTADPATIARWAPLLMAGRRDEVVAATRVAAGTDVDFGELARGLLAWLAVQDGCGVATGHRVRSIRKRGGEWSLRIQNETSKAVLEARAPFVFVGAGGGSLPLLQQAGIAEGRGIGGFPIGGRWLVCDKPEIVEQHHAKVYGQALGTAPTMAVPHLDSRVLDGKRVLLFGPFAAWTSKFLHGGGSHLDLPKSMRLHNVLTLTNVALKNLDLIRYLVQQGQQSKEDRLRSLRDFYPEARSEDWHVIDAGIRVQAIRSYEGKTGIVHYGTEVITDQARTIAALLGASPGASVSTSVAVQLLEQCMPAILRSPAGRERMQAIVPFYGTDIKQPGNANLYLEASQRASRTLQLAN